MQFQKPSAEAIFRVSLFIYLNCRDVCIFLYAAPSSSPSEVLVLDVFSSNFTVQWAPPPVNTHNGILRGYLVNITELNTARNFVRTTSETSLVVSHLHPYYIYHVTVLAATVSHGPPTAGVTVTTLETSEFVNLQSCRGLQVG